MTFKKSAFANEAAKSIVFRMVLQPKIRKITIIFYLQTISQFSFNFYGISWISTPFWAPKYNPKPFKNRFWELLATIWHRFGAARSNLDGFWAPWARFFIDLAFIFEWIERGFCKQSLDEQYALVAALHMALLLSHGMFLTVIWCGGVRIAPPPPPKGARRARC